MASNKSVVVLTPNGRRQNVKVNPNMTILQILEEVCTKHGFDPSEYDLKHHNNVMDVSSILRFTGLPNNALLEMITIRKARPESPVILVVQLENGDRLTGNFLPNCNLWDVLNELCPSEIQADKNPVMIYMRQEIHRPALSTTTLKSLGLTGGRALIRLVNRRPDELKTQANVSSLLPSKPAGEKAFYKKPKELRDLVFAPSNSTVTQMKPPDQTPQSSKQDFITKFVEREKNKEVASTSRAAEVMEVETPDERDVLEDLTFLGERNALAFSLDSAPSVPHEDLPDEFFELTIKDAKKVLRDLQKKRNELEENPLQTAMFRKLEESKKMLRMLNQYKRTVIRIQFPDRAVLQGTFKPSETVEEVKTFVRKYLEDPNTQFYLYTTPPKCDLDPEKTLLDVDCVPSALLHFGVPTAFSEHDKFLKRSLYNHFISPNVASVAATKSRGKQRIIESDSQSELDLTNLPGPSQPSTAYDSEPSTSKATQDSDSPEKKVPKWFKLNK